ncbi:RNA methyltransferase [Chitinibacter bivalviorum]|uniref:tRNA (cytidine/uridine-2'-O-)-methyltransferase TrmJ n=1 Tax=Chitinibacter bivalviorum TaxID=2739434 RepID=A0A7H9BIF7_9NEIS|nr:RNA methyltransferase [Chitinibacter bivalviorum]QLG87741.1 RNA methyltransferase [Chitinibacter bivalviorum]
MNKEINKNLYQGDETACLPQIRVVLSHTSHPGNIGSTARAMKTMGLTELYLINPKEFPSEVATALASSADDILQNAKVVSSMAEALAGTTMQVALTARRRELSQPLQTPRQIAPSIIRSARAGQEIALVFGAETSGLTIDELSMCSDRVTIPTNPHYSSLNLSQAVQVLTYELRTSCFEADWVDVQHLEEERDPATHEAMERFFEHLEEVMLKIGFLRPHAPKRLMPRLRRLFIRAELEREEVDILRGILKATTEFDRKP